MPKGDLFSVWEQYLMKAFMPTGSNMPGELTFREVLRSNVPLRFICLFDTLHSHILMSSGSNIALSENLPPPFRRLYTIRWYYYSVFGKSSEMRYYFFFRVPEQYYPQEVMQFYVADDGVVTIAIPPEEPL
jgi:hypothetical protein